MVRGRRWTSAALGAGLALAAGCSSSGAPAGGAAGTTAGASSPTTAVALSAAATSAADTLTDGGGFDPAQARCVVSVLVARLGEADGLKLVSETTADSLTAAQQEALDAGLTGCLSADDLGGIVGVAVQASAAESGATMSKPQIACAGNALIAKHTLRGLLFEPGLLDRALADVDNVRTILTTCVSGVLADAVAGVAAAAAEDRIAQTAARNAFVVAKGTASDSGSYAGLTQAALAAAATEPGLTFTPDAAPSTGNTVVSWRLATVDAGTTIYLAVRAATGACWLMRDSLDDDGTVAKRIYGTVAAPAAGATAAPCTAAVLADTDFTEAWA